MTEFPRREPTFQHSPPLWKEMGRGKEKNIYIYIYMTEAIFLAAFLFGAKPLVLPLGANLGCFRRSTAFYNPPPL